MMKHFMAYLFIALMLLPLGHPCSAMLETEKPVASCCAAHQPADEVPHHCKHDHQGQESSAPDSSDQESNGCNPSCSCTCCGLISILIAPISLPPVLVSPEWAAHYPPGSQYTYDFASSIWQPPRLS